MCRQASACKKNFTKSAARRGGKRARGEPGWADGGRGRKKRDEGRGKAPGKEIRVKKYAAVIIGEGGPYNKKKEKRTKAGAFDKKRQNSSRPPIFRLSEFVSIEVSNENNLF